jgi:S-adenosylmethionine:tRNA ribosyltransferase-isomerase
VAALVGCAALDTADFDYVLPDAGIAQRPAEPRDSARLLVDLDGDVAHRHVRDLAELLDPGDLVVVNTTRVLPARLPLVKDTGGVAEVLLLEERSGGQWEALVRPSRRIAPGSRLRSTRTDLLSVVVGEDLGDGLRLVTLDLATGPAGGSTAPTDLLEVLTIAGEMPLPPYLTEGLDDPERYQTVFADRAASAAAPTAGLHLTTELLERLPRRGVEVVDVELVVGLGTFRPMTAERVEDHQMHAERYRVPSATSVAVDETHRRGGRVVAVGTTVVRALESAARSGEVDGRTELFIHGDYPFQLVDRLITNFHLPRSSLLVMIDAFAGPRWRELYAAAQAGGYRFLSFGDAMLLTRHDRWPARPGAGS